MLSKIGFIWQAKKKSKPESQFFTVQMLSKQNYQCGGTGAAIAAIKSGQVFAAEGLEEVDEVAGVEEEKLKLQKRYRKTCVNFMFTFLRISANLPERANRWQRCQCSPT